MFQRGDLVSVQSTRYVGPAVVLAKLSTWEGWDYVWILDPVLGPIRGYVAHTALICRQET